VANDFTDVLQPIYANGLMVLRETCILPRLVNTSFSTDAANKGQVINVPKAAAITASAVSPSYVPPDTTGVTADYSQISLSNWYETRFYMTDKEMGEVVNGYLPKQAEEAVRGLAYKVNATIAALYPSFYGYTGTAGTTPFAIATASAVDQIADAIAIRKVLNQQLAPLDNRHVVLDPVAEANLYGLRAFADASWSGDTQTIMAGKLNQRLGMQWWVDQQVAYHTAGTAANATVSNAGHAAGVTTLALTAAGTGTFVVGDIITIADDTTGQTYTVTSGDADVSNGGSISISPPLRTTLSAATHAITRVASHRANLAFHRDAIGFASRLLDAGGPPNPNSMAIADPVSNLAMRLEVTREHKRWCWSYDMLWGCAVIDARLGMRVAG